MTINPTSVIDAQKRIHNVVNHTPIMRSRTLDDHANGRVFLKCENFQRVGAFKFRGAYNTLAQLGDTEKAAGVITHSSGNHAQGVALAAKLLGIQATIVMPHDAPVVKRQATADYGATIVACEAAEREMVCHQLSERQGLTLIHAYNDPRIIAGQGTAALELLQEAEPLDLLFAPVGGGGLISGTALAATHFPGCKVIGVEPQAADDATRSWRENRIVRLDAVPDTIADGLRVRFIGELNLAVMRKYLANMVTVSEANIVKTLEFLWTRMKLIVEPSAAVALAPLFCGQYPLYGRRAGVILSGGNVDISVAAALFEAQ